MRFTGHALSDRCLPIAWTMLLAACASAPRNPVLDHYPAGVTGRTTVMHYDVHGRTFEEVRGDMRRLGPKIIEKLHGISGPCSTISTHANDIARAIVERAHQRALASDAETRHGYTQGTAFGIRRFSGMIVGDVPDAPTLLAGPRVGTVRGFLPASLERAWAAMPAAFAANGLTINATDTSAHAMGDSVIARGTIGRLPVGELVDCGTPPAGRNADSVEVALFITSRLVPSEPSATTVTNTLHAVARPPDGAPVACRSRGVLERRLFDALRNQVAR